MKHYVLIPTFILSILFTLNSCNSDDTYPKPVINLTELGYENSKIGYIGGDLHVEADIVAEGRIETITLEIRPETLYPTKDDEFWSFDSTYTEFNDLKSTEFHKHVDIPLDAMEGLYYVQLIVIDQEGQQTIHSESLSIQVPTDSIAPVISITTAPAENAIFQSGGVIEISGLITDDIALGGLYVGLVRVDQLLEDSLVSSSNTITLRHTHDFEPVNSYNFNASITVGSAYDNDMTPKELIGEFAWQSTSYYILVKCKDAFGSIWTYSARYPISINL